MKPAQALNRIYKNLNIKLLLTIFLGLLLAGCAANVGGNDITSTQEQSEENQINTRPLQKKSSIKVALLLPLSSNKGSTAKIAKSLKQAGELALFDFDNPNILLTTKDTKGTPEGAQQAAQLAVNSGAEIIIGPLYSGSVKAAAPIARQANIPMIAFSSDESVAGNGVYLLSFLAGKDIPRIVSYMISQGKQRFAALIPKTPYGNLVEISFKNAVTQLGGQLVAIEKYPLNANGMLEPAQRISELTKDEINPIDALLIPGGRETLPTLAPLMPYFEIDTQKVQLFGTGRWDYANIGREKPLIGGFFPAPDPSGWRDFTQKFVKTYGNAPPRIASLSYDAVSLAVSLSNKPRSERFTARQLTRPSGFAGVDGLFRLKTDGTSERGLAILEVQKFGPRVVDPAPNTFRQADF